ncbi:F-box protein PP2-B10-like [Panicum miliaceum]|uniref:F-box protein PP2-B10-like n=1 Tax=Panicum miliaceum TaxID=4540 RepID=A0A3L6R2I9_PANMI|nr:F-box protein PP2-B10-like [Panicum miliaceum]
MRVATQLGDLLEACMAQAIALTSPRDACRCAVVSPAFRAAADSDHVWRAFLPPQLDNRYRPAPVVLQPAPAPTAARSKEAYLGLCEAPGVAAVGEDSGCRVWLDRGTGAVAAGCRAGGQGRSAPGGSAPRRAEAPAAEGIGIELGLYGPVGHASRAKQAAVRERGSIGVALATREAGDPPARARRAALRRRRAWL